MRDQGNPAKSSRFSWRVSFEAHDPAVANGYEWMPLKTRRLPGFCLGVPLMALCQASNAQDASNSVCNQVHAIASMALATSHPALATSRHDAERSYRAEIVYAARSFELQPGNKNAALRLLKLLPQDGAQHTTLMTLGDSLCDGESVAEMILMSRLGERLPRDLAEAVLLAPQMLSKYVAYASLSVQDPHSDYAVRMQPVCQAKHAEFVRAVKELPGDKREWFVNHVFNPESCHAVAFPEAE